MKRQIKISGAIVPTRDLWVYDLLEIPATAPQCVEAALREANGEPVEVVINSPGGDVFAGSEIYTLLRGYRGKVRIQIQSLAASAAAIIAMAGESEMSPVAQLMIHNVSSYAAGDYRDMEHMAEVLENANEAMAAAFVAKTGRPEAEILDMMNKETWFTAERAVKEGFVDRIMFDQTQTQQSGGIQLAASYNSGLLPGNVLEKLRSILPTQPAKAMAEAQYNLLILEGKSK